MRRQAMTKRLNQEDMEVLTLNQAPRLLALGCREGSKWVEMGMGRNSRPAWWLIPRILSTWNIPGSCGISSVNTLATGFISHLPSGMNHQVGDHRWFRLFFVCTISLLGQFWPIPKLLGGVPKMKIHLDIIGIYRNEKEEWEPRSSDLQHECGCLTTRYLEVIILIIHHYHEL